MDFGQPSRRSFFQSGGQFGEQPNSPFRTVPPEVLITTNLPLDHLRKESVGIGSTYPSQFKYNINKFIICPHVQIDSFMELSDENDRHCVTIEVPMLTAESARKVGISEDIEFSAGLSGSIANELKWRLRLFRDGVDHNSKGFISLFLCLESALNDQPVHVKFSFTGNKLNEYEKAFTPGDMWGFKKWKNTNLLSPITFEKSKICVKCGSKIREARSLFIAFYITVPSESQLKSLYTDKENRIEIEKSFWLRGFSLRDSKRIIPSFFSNKAEIILKTSENCYFVHKEILVRESEMFEAMFKHDTAESLSNTVEINISIDEVSMCYVLEYMYFHRVSEERQVDWSAILNFANYYDLPKLKSMACAHLIVNVENENVIDTLFLAENHNVSNLKSFCLKYINNKASEIKNTESWLKLKGTPHLCFEVLNEMIGD